MNEPRLLVIGQIAQATWTATEARRLGVTRQAFIKIRLADSLQQP